MTRWCLSPEQKDITISGNRFSGGILKALFRNILQYLLPPQTVPRANMFAGIFVKSKHDRMVGESVQSLTKLIKTQPNEYLWKMSYGISSVMDAY